MQALSYLTLVACCGKAGPHNSPSSTLELSPQPQIQAALHVIACESI
jgi:hypothetical protein